VTKAPLTARASGDPALCQSFLRNDDAGLDYLKDTEPLTLPGYTVTDGIDDVMHLSIDFDNDGKFDRVRWTRGKGPYFTGDYFILVPEEAGPTQDAATRLRGDQSVERFLEALRKDGVPSLPARPRSTPTRAASISS
jgi:hypothetical protein